jgi:hypothetical protein
MRAPGREDILHGRREVTSVRWRAGARGRSWHRQGAGSSRAGRRHRPPPMSPAAWEARGVEARGVAVTVTVTAVGPAPMGNFPEVVLARELRGPCSRRVAAPTIVKENSNGSCERKIQVDDGDDIRWTVHPKGPSSGADACTVIVDARKDWDNTSSAMLRSWAAYQGQMSVPVYSPDGQLMAQDTPVTVMRMSGYLPHVEVHVHFRVTRCRTTRATTRPTGSISTSTGTTRTSRWRATTGMRTSTSTTPDFRARVEGAAGWAPPRPRITCRHPRHPRPALLPAGNAVVTTGRQSGYASITRRESPAATPGSVVPRARHQHPS